MCTVLPSACKIANCPRIFPTASASPLRTAASAASRVVPNRMSPLGSNKFTMRSITGDAFMAMFLMKDMNGDSGKDDGRQCSSLRNRLMRSRSMRSREGFTDQPLVAFSIAIRGLMSDRFRQRWRRAVAVPVRLLQILSNELLVEGPL